MVYAQDKSEKLRVKIDDQLKDINTKLNPHFFMGHLKGKHKLAAKRDYMPLEASAKDRVALVESKGREQRVERVKDEMRILDYMKSQGYEPNSGQAVTSLNQQGSNSTQNGNGTREILAKFRSEVAIHPVRDIVAAEMRLIAERAEMRENIRL